MIKSKNRGGTVHKNFLTLINNLLPSWNKSQEMLHIKEDKSNVHYEMKIQV